MPRIDLDDLFQDRDRFRIEAGSGKLIGDHLVVDDRIGAAIAAREEIAQPIEHQQVFGGVLRQTLALFERLPRFPLLQQSFGVREGLLAIEGHGLLPLAAFLNSRLLPCSVPQEI